jgi:two-component system response regulator NreC
MLIRVLLVDDHAVVRAGLRLVLERVDGIEVVGEAGNAEHAVALALAQQPNVIVLDVLLPGGDGIAAIGDLLAAAPASRVLMLSSIAAAGTIRQAFDAGASGYSIKRASDADVIAAVRAVAEGRRYVHPELGAGLAESVRHGPLSPRELDVLRLVALGHTNSEIAAELVLSTRTVEMHRAGVMRKLGFQTRAQLVAYAIASGLIGC